jgi:hypothetical protein
MVVKAPFFGLPAGMPTQAANTLAYYDQVWQDLIDWPNAVDSLNDDAAFPEGATCCHDGHVPSNVSTPINAHVAHAHRRLAAMSRWLGRPVSRPFPSCARAILAEIYRCRPCSCVESEDGEKRPGRHRRRPRSTPKQTASSVVCSSTCCCPVTPPLLSVRVRPRASRTGSRR